MTMIDASQLVQDQIPYKPERKLSMTTISTSAMSSSTGSSQMSDPSKPELRLPNEHSSSLMQMIAKDVVNSLLSGAADADDLSEGGSLCSNMSRLNLDLEHIADMVLTQIEQQHQGSDHELRMLLRQGLASTTDASDDVPDEHSLQTDEHSVDFQSSKYFAAASHITASTVSEISLETGEIKPAVDIYDPDFWGAATTDEALVAEDGYSRESNSTPSTNRSVHTILSSDHECGTVHSRASLHEFIQRVNEASSESESDSSDSCSVLSDITGLTGCFDAGPSELRGQVMVSSESRVLSVASRDSGAPSDERSRVGNSLSSKVSTNSSNRVVCADGKPVLNRRVSFGRVSVRHYERIMCDNPSSTTGPSIGIGWGFVNKRSKDIDDFEKDRLGRHKSELLLSRAQREKIIKSLGYTDREIAAMVRDINKCRFQRRQTVNNLGAQKLEESLELAKRQVLKAVFLRKKVKF